MWRPIAQIEIGIEIVIGFDPDFDFDPGSIKLLRRKIDYFALHLP